MTAAAVARARTRSAVVLSRRLLHIAAAFPPDSRPALRLERLAREVDAALRKGRKTTRYASWHRGLDLETLDAESLALAAGFDAPPTRLPFVLVSQAARSGGTLLLRLFDGHPACLTVPHELGRMLPSRPLPRDPAAVFEALTPRPVFRWHASGVEIGWTALSGPRRHTHAFRLPPALLRRLLTLLLERFPAGSDRDVLDAYVTAYFSAWLDGPGLGPGRRWLVGFEPAGIAKEGRMERFAENYPDGRMISIVRDPWSWFVSARRWDRRLTSPRVALRLWLQAAEATIRVRHAQPERVLVVSFDDLLRRTGTSMEAAAAFLGIPFDEVLTAPTINGLPADANSSFSDVRAGVSAAPLSDRLGLLTRREERLVGRLAGETWDRVLALVGS